MDMSVSKNESIKNMIESLEKGIIALPQFQRDFVWDITRTYDLFDSLIKDIFIGSIIYGKPSFEITTREIDKRPRKGKKEKLKIESFSVEKIKAKTDSDGFRIILDGQQRITSLYRALNDIDKVWFIAKNESDYDENDRHEKKIKDKPFKDRTLEEILHEVSGEEDSGRLSIKLGDVYQMIDKSFREQYVMDNFFNKLKCSSDLSKSDRQAMFDNYLFCRDKIRSIITGENRLLSYYLLDMSIDKFALFFERSNSKGLTLDFTDILAAKLYSGFKLRDKIEQFEDNNSNFKEYFNKEIIVRTIAYIVGEGKKKIDRAFILKELTHEHFNQYWDQVCKWYMEALNFLYGNHFIISQSWTPYENMLIPLMIFRKALGNDFSQMNDIQSKFIHYWYWSSIFSQRYTGASNEVIIKDANYMQRIARNEKISEKAYFNRLAKLQITKYEDIFDYSKKGNAVYKGILNLVNYKSKGLIGWKNSDKLNFNDSRLEDHHIFPKNYMKKKFSNNQDAIDKTESVVNRTLIPKIENIKIGDKTPSSYLKELKKENPNLEKSLKNHLISVKILEGIYDDYYDNFYEERAKEIYRIIEDLVINKADETLSLFYKDKDSESSTSGNIRIYGNYQQKQVEATFNIETQEVLYKGQKHTPSGAAKKVKEDLGKAGTKTNGWEFWKFKDKDGIEKSLTAFRSAKEQYPI